MFFYIFQSNKSNIHRLKSVLKYSTRILSILVVSRNKKRITLQCIKGILVTAIFSIINILLIIAGIEKNPGPKSKINKLSFAVWNIDSIMARNKCKIALIESLNAVSQYDLFGLCETYLTKDISDSDIKIAGFSPPPTELIVKIRQEEVREVYAFFTKIIFP